MKTVYIIGGSNGAGKTTLAETVLPDYLKVDEFVNADQIAGGMSAFRPETVSIDAGKAMLNRIHELAAAGQDFAFETTLASRTFAPFLQELKSRGYTVILIYVWLRSPRLALRRVRLRAAKGGHDVPEAIVTRRYKRGLENLRKLYLPIADGWFVFDNSAPRPELIAECQAGGDMVVHNSGIWENIYG
jgi:predicted ABC-type ATPase